MSIEDHGWSCHNLLETIDVWEQDAGSPDSLAVVIEHFFKVDDLRIRLTEADSIALAKHFGHYKEPTSNLTELQLRDLEDERGY